MALDVPGPARLAESLSGIVNGALFVHMIVTLSSHHNFLFITLHLPLTLLYNTHSLSFFPSFFLFLSLSFSFFLSLSFSISIYLSTFALFLLLRMRLCAILSTSLKIMMPVPT